MLKLYLKIWSLGGGQGAGADHYEILELAKVVVIWDSVKKVKQNVDTVATEAFNGM